MKEDATKQVKKLQQQVKEAGREAEEARAGREEAAGAAREAERRGKALEAAAAQHAEELAAAERARRHAEAERDDLLDELAAAAAKVTALNLYNLSPSLSLFFSLSLSLPLHPVRSSPMHFSTTVKITPIYLSI